jgi:hypothetical protein
MQKKMWKKGDGTREMGVVYPTLVIGYDPCGRGNGNRVGLDPPVHAYGPAFGHTGFCPCFGRVDGPAIGSSEGWPTSQTAPGYKTIRS